MTVIITTVVFALPMVAFLMAASSESKYYDALPGAALACSGMVLTEESYLWPELCRENRC